VKVNGKGPYRLIFDTGAPIKVPVGRGTLGRVMDLLGNPIDGLGPVTSDDQYAIHRAAPKLEDQEPTPRVFEIISN
jgi:F-type H+-transporting ATPase subunit beta